MAELGRLVKPMIDGLAPDPVSRNPFELARLAKFAKHLRGQGEEWLLGNLKMMTMSAVDFLSEWFECEQLIAPMSVSGIIGTFLGVRSPGTAYVLLHHYMGEIDGSYRAWGLPKGGTGAVAEAIAASARELGVEIRLSAPVASVTMQDGRATGVVLENGDEIAAKAVVSGVDPHRTFLKLVGEKHLEPDFAKQVKRFKMRGSSGKVNLALDALPEFACLPGEGRQLHGDITIAPSIEYLERAYDDAKYGAFSRKPFMDVVIPSLTDPTVAPPGKHTMSIFVQYAPYNLKEGAADWPNQREAFGDAVIDTLSEYMPNLKSRILHRQVLSPWDLEQIYGLTEGNIFHGELSLEQLAFLRPVAGWSRYRTPIEDLWMCASGTHPGAGSWALRAPSARARCCAGGRSRTGRWPAAESGTTRSSWAAGRTVSPRRFAWRDPAGESWCSSAARRSAGSWRRSSSTLATSPPASCTTRVSSRRARSPSCAWRATGSSCATRRRSCSPRREGAASCWSATPLRPRSSSRRARAATPRATSAIARSSPGSRRWSPG